MLSATNSLILEALGQTIYMIIVSGFISVLGGLPLGVILLTTRPHGILENKFYNHSLGIIVNIVRAIPFIILLVVLVPLTRLIVGTSIGTNAAIVPLSIGAIPFVARIVENSLMEVGNGLVEAGEAMGATPWQIIIKILLPEALPSIVKGITVTLIALVGYSAMAGAVGGGGLGSVAINYGYQQFNARVMFVTVVLLIVLVYFIQILGDLIADKLRRV